MSTSAAIAPFVKTILHTTDFSPASEAAFAHALAICLFRKGELTILHAGDEYMDGDEWQQFPHVRKTLERWKLLAPGSSRAAVFHELGIRVNKISAKGDPLTATLEYLGDYPTDLMVLATEGREGLPRFMRRSTAEKLSRHANIKTLFVPQEARGFVQLSGDLTMRKVLVPVAAAPDPRPALTYAARASELAGGEPVELIALHVGGHDPQLALPKPYNPRATWRRAHVEGEPEDEILRFAESESVDLIFMATQGVDTFREVVAGRTTERVMRRAPCPVCVVPEG